MTRKTDFMIHDRSTSLAMMGLMVCVAALALFLIASLVHTVRAY